MGVKVARIRQKSIKNDYFDWILGKIGVKKTEKSTILALKWLFNKEFEWTIDNDMYRAADGVDLRYDYSYEAGVDFLTVRKELENRPCSCLEMMVALALRCENSIMGDPEKGNRTGVWFNVMINSLGLHLDCSPDDEEAVERWFDLDYSRNGKGGLFYIPGTRRDLRKIEIWSQMMLYLDTFYYDEIGLE